MKKALFVVAPQGFKDEEYFKPKEILKRAGVKVFTCSTSDKAKSVLGQIIKVDLLLDSVVEVYDAIVFVGGPGASIYFRNSEAHELIKRHDKEKKIIAAICIAPSILANAGILFLRKVTAFSSEKENLERSGAEYTGKSVTVDKNIVTGRDPSSAEEFGAKILERI